MADRTRGFKEPSNHPEVQRRLRALIRTARNCGKVGLQPSSEGNGDEYRRLTRLLAQEAAAFVYAERTHG